MSYCSIEDLRNEGITEEQFDDNQLDKLIAVSCAYIDRVTGQWFELREKTISLDGRGGRILALPVFLYDVSCVKIDGEEAGDFVLYNRIEDRAYPKMFRHLRWPKGRLNIEVSGRWGYVEEDGTTPLAIKRAAMKLALYNFPSLNDAEAQEEKNLRRLLVSETTDGHNYSLSSEAVADLYSSALTGDVEIDQILKNYMCSHFKAAVV